ncbi:hypothetical protein VTN77DRAFT_9064 [Rasamsonia byssochlamydoides]|uniref:uncharacterized protein n=1 Tax=Rasamsonia byssochlamydoides TaxID=89139 RepID=UPI003744A5BF
MASIDNVPDSVPAETRQTETSTGEATPSPEKETTATASPEKSATVVNESSSAAAEESVQPAGPTITAAAPTTETSVTKTSAGPETTATGESSDQFKAAVKEAEDSGPSLVITLLLTTGARYPFKIDGKYLRKRGVNVENYDPFAMSVYTLKELIWREWRSEWEPRPSSPSLIRLISFGKLLDDKSPLSESKFNHDAPNVIHMTVKPQEVVDEEDAKGGKAYQGRDRDTTERSPHCRCIIL